MSTPTLPAPLGLPQRGFRGVHTATTATSHADNHARPTLAQLQHENGATLVKPPVRYPSYRLTRFRVTSTAPFAAERLQPHVGHWTPVYNEHTLTHLRSLAGV